MDDQLKERPLKTRIPGNKKTVRIQPDREELDDDLWMDIDSGDESDGRNALRVVEAREEPRVARRGPGNASMQHFHDPTATVDRLGQKRWEFQCCFCALYVKNKR